ncbi:hypothetical protein MNBD_ALPHA07-533 [hydrothermal vent metagenome]|uniref:Uncharacterized protein n=1 Tax=hydrothermal vent metagenome TaxID=652676 RepID=A0A3B0TB85_9ZZZZ
MTSATLDPFQRERQRLIALAYRMLGERAAAEDIVQDVWLRWSGAADQDIANPAAWLHRVTTRLAIDALRSARNRRESYVGPWLPEPLMAETGQSGEDKFAMAQECQLALLWAMERLSPEGRAAFILRRAFDTDYAELAGILNKSEAACRQLVSRAAKQVKSQKPRFKPNPAETAALLAKFAQATMAQDHATVLSLLAPDVVAISDGGGNARAAFRPLVGAEEVAQVVLSIALKKTNLTGLKVIRANQSPALAILEGGPDDMIYTITSNEDGLINWIYTMRNPDKLPLN